jgi:hypothetical protein
MIAIEASMKFLIEVEEEYSIFRKPNDLQARKKAK